MLPGGGLEEGESWEDAALREMWEETGISGVPIGPLLWTRRANDHYHGEPILQDERYYLVRCGMQTITNEYQLEEEKRIYTRHEWWSLAGIRASGDTFYPERLADLLLPVIQNRISPSPLALPE